jgi:hypothetical protein
MQRPDERQGINGHQVSNVEANVSYVEDGVCLCGVCLYLVMGSCK